MGQLHGVEEQQQQESKEMSERMMTQAQRILANAIARFFYIGESRGFEKWRDYVEDQRRKEYLIQKMIGHMRKFQYERFIRSFKAWIANADIEERRKGIAKEEAKIDDTTAVREQQTAIFVDNKTKLDGEMVVLRQLHQKYGH